MTPMDARDNLPAAITFRGLRAPGLLRCWRSPGRRRPRAAWCRRVDPPGPHRATYPSDAGRPHRRRRFGGRGPARRSPQRRRETLGDSQRPPESRPARPLGYLRARITAASLASRNRCNLATCTHVIGWSQGILTSKQGTMSLGALACVPKNGAAQRARSVAAKSRESERPVTSVKLPFGQQGWPSSLGTQETPGWHASVTGVNRVRAFPRPLSRCRDAE